jgi:hypothetical protein
LLGKTIGMCLAILVSLSALMVSPAPASAHVRAQPLYVDGTLVAAGRVNSNHYTISVQDHYCDGSGAEADAVVDYVMHGVSGVYRLTDRGCTGGWVSQNLLAPVAAFRVCHDGLGCTAPASPISGWTSP